MTDKFYYNDYIKLKQDKIIHIKLKGQRKRPMLGRITAWGLYNMVCALVEKPGFLFH